MVFLTALMILSFYGFRNILKQREHKEVQIDEFLGCTITSHGFNHDMDIFYTFQAFQRVQGHPIQSSIENDTAP